MNEIEAAKEALQEFVKVDGLMTKDRAMAIMLLHMNSNIELLAREVARLGKKQLERT